MPTSRTSAADPMLPLWLALALAAAIIGADLALREPGRSLTREHGGIETASAVLYLFAVALWLARRSAADLRRSWQVPAVLLLMAAREFDFDKRFTSVGLLKSNLYLTDQAPVWERLIGLAVVVVLGVVLFRLVRHDARPFLRALRIGDPAAWAVAAGIATAVLAKSVDGIGRKLAPFGVTVDEALGDQVGATEEVIELFIPLLFIFAIARAARDRGRP